MSTATVVVSAAVLLVVVLAVLTTVLLLEVRRLREQVDHLARASSGPEPVVEAAANLDKPRVQEELILLPTPMDAVEREPDLDLSVSRVASVTLSGPLIKVAAFSSGLRRALSEESRMRIGLAFRKELRRQRKARRRRAAGPGPVAPEAGRPR